MKTLRHILLLIFLTGILGTSIELLLLDHTEDYWQLVPLVSFGAGLLSLAALWARPTAATLRLVRYVAASFLASGALGLLLHYRGNVEFELEMYPSLGGFKLFWEAMTGATPALAPGAVAHLGLVGLAYTYRHPLLGSLNVETEDTGDPQ